MYVRQNSLARLRCQRTQDNRPRTNGRTIGGTAIRNCKSALALALCGSSHMPQTHAQHLSEYRACWLGTVECRSLCSCRARQKCLRQCSIAKKASRLGGRMLYTFAHLYTYYTPTSSSKPCYGFIPIGIYYVLYGTLDGSDDLPACTKLLIYCDVSVRSGPSEGIQTVFCTAMEQCTILL